MKIIDSCLEKCRFQTRVAHLQERGYLCLRIEQQYMGYRMDMTTLQKTQMEEQLKGLMHFLRDWKILKCLALSFSRLTQRVKTSILLRNKWETTSKPDGFLSKKFFYPFARNGHGALWRKQNAQSKWLHSKSLCLVMKKYSFTSLQILVIFLDAFVSAGGSWKHQNTGKCNS